MTDETTLGLRRGPDETVLPVPPPAWTAELERALAERDPSRKDSVAAVAAAHPSMLAAWAALARSATDPVERYAYARTGYHRGLDALRAAGWKGTGYVRAGLGANSAFLDCLDALRLAAGAIGESDEEERCRLFLRQLDPGWGRGS